MTSAPVLDRPATPELALPPRYVRVAGYKDFHAEPSSLQELADMRQRLLAGGPVLRDPALTGNPDQREIDIALNYKVFGRSEPRGGLLGKTNRLRQLTQEHLGPAGFWELLSVDVEHDAIRSRDWIENVITDNGATAMLKNAFNQQAGQPIVPAFQFYVMDNYGGSTALSAATGTLAITSISVAATPGPIANGASLTIGYGQATNQVLTVNGAVAANATAITVTSFTPSINYPIGTPVVVTGGAGALSTGDDFNTMVGANGTKYYVTASSWAFSGAGAGNRQVLVTVTFAATTGAQALTNYNEIWAVNTNPVSGANQTGQHLTMAQQVINGVTALTLSAIIKL